VIDCSARRSSPRSSPPSDSAMTARLVTSYCEEQRQGASGQSLVSCHVRPQAEIAGPSAGRSSVVAHQATPLAWQVRQAPAFAAGKLAGKAKQPRASDGACGGQIEPRHKNPLAIEGRLHEPQQLRPSASPEQQRHRASCRESHLSLRTEAHRTAGNSSTNQGQRRPLPASVNRRRYQVTSFRKVAVPDDEKTERTRRKPRSSRSHEQMPRSIVS